MMEVGGRSLQDCRRAILKVMRSSFGRGVRGGPVSPLSLGIEDSGPY